MALLESLNLPLNSPMPHFSLSDPNGKSYHSDDLFGDKGLLLVFTCNHCPYAIAVWPRLIQLASFAKTLGVNTVAINPNINPDYPDDSPQQMLKKIAEWGIHFPYLVDANQELAKSFKAQCTPDIYLYDANNKLAYHGRIDDNWKDESKVTRQELKAAIVAIANGTTVSPEQFPSMGCSIKWK